MDAAKNAIHKITGRQGHTTEVDEYVAPAVTSETVKPHRHEETTTAVDKEVHQDHFHTTVQPVAHREVLPEKHQHVQAPAIEKEYKHDDGRTHERVAAELAQFKNTTQTTETSHSRTAAPTVTGEHVHHHVHETVQPVIHKETIQPEVVHTTVPVHEVHHASAQHHGVSALPMKTLDEFKSSGGLAGTKTHTHEEYDGAPRPYNEKFSTKLEHVLPGSHHTSHTGTTGTTGTSGLNTSSHNNRDSGVSGVGHNSHSKPSLADKLNPKTDADRDGKAGIMD